MKKNIYFFIWILLFILFTTTNVFAITNETNIQISVSPAIIDVKLSKGDSKDTEVYVFNHETTPVAVKINAKSFIPSEAIPEDKKNFYDASKWITIDPSEVIINPNENKIIKINIKAPKEIDAGGHYATIYFESLKENNLNSSINIGKRVGVITLITIDGEVSKKIQADSLKFNRLTFNGPKEFTINFSNDGNIHELPGGSIIIENINHKEIKRITLPVKLILPFTKREIIISNDEDLSTGIYFVKAEILYGNESKKIIPSFFIVVSGKILFTLTGLLTLISTSLIISWQKFAKAFRIIFKK